MKILAMSVAMHPCSLIQKSKINIELFCQGLKSDLSWLRTLTKKSSHIFLVGLFNVAGRGKKKLLNQQWDNLRLVLPVHVLQDGILL